MAGEVGGCILCGGNRHRVLFRNFDRLHGKPGVFEIVRCEACGLVSTRPQPEDISRYYPDEYEPHNLKPERGGWARLMRILQRFVASPVPPELKRSKGKFLDIGCGTGVFLKELQTAGWEVHGVDISEKAIAVAREKLGLKNVKVGTLEGVRYPDEFFDVINMSHLIEHLPDPLGTLKEVKRVLRFGGCLVVTTPNFASVGARIFRGFWFPLDTPRHLYLFSPQTIKLLFGKVGGLEVIRERYDFSAYCLARSLGYLTGWPKFWLKVKPIFWPLTTLTAIWGKSDVLTISARRMSPQVEI